MSSHDNATAKFLFDEDFAAGDKREADDHAGRARAPARRRRDRGLSQRLCRRRKRKAQSEAAQRAAAALARIADGLERLDRALAGIEARLETEAVEVAVAVAGKLAPALIAREPFAEISALATECFRELVATPHVVVRVGADIYDDAPRKSSRRSRGRAASRAGWWCWASRASRAGDCRIEWADGGVARDRGRTRPRSTTRSPATWRAPQRRDAIRNSGDRRDE